MAPAGYRSFRQAVPMWLKEKLHLPSVMRKAMQGAYRGRYVFTDHHESHAASTFFPSPFDEAAIITFDGVGEWSTTCFGTGRGNRIELTHEIRFPHSLGLLYAAFTYYTGFRVNSGEYKVMGLAPYGKPIYKDLILERLLDLKEDGSYRMDMSYFNYCQGLTMTSQKFHELFGGPPRQPESLLTQREMDLAASIQAVTEEVMLRTARHVHRRTGMKNLVLAGGVALNCVGNGRILREGPFENLWIQPAAGDAGGAGRGAVHLASTAGKAAVAAAAATCSRARCSARPSPTRRSPKSCNARARSSKRPPATSNWWTTLSRMLAEEKVVGWFQGRMEFGPRALARGASWATPAARNAVGDEPQDQVPRIVPALRADRAPRAGRPLVPGPALRRQPLHAAGGPGPRGNPHPAEAGRGAGVRHRATCGMPARRSPR